MRILILNWRSIKDPLAGGAELATFEHAKRWVKSHNATVYWLSPKYKKNLHYELIEGVNFVYIGLHLNRNILHLLYRFPLFYLLVFVKYFQKYRNNVDVVIDQVHGLPYLTPLFVKEPIIVHVNEIAGDIWDKMYKFPVNKVGKFLEKLIFKPYIWKKTTFVSISESTKKDILSLGIRETNIKVVYCGVSMEVLESPSHKEEKFTVIFLNRLVKMKGIERAIEIVSLARNSISEIQFWIVGHGEPDYVQKLQGQVKMLKLDSQTKFWGFVTDEEKINLLSRAHVLINASYKEGWGLVNIEANCNGTPVVAFEVPGNIESVLNGQSGYLAADNNLQEMADLFVKVKNEPGLSLSSLEFAKRFDWEKVSEEYYSILKSSIDANT
jgi:glycosyltransferase involved in cell wall biosynthesis